MQQDMLDLILLSQNSNTTVWRSPPAGMAGDKSSSTDSCPVDHKSRQVWLEKAGTAGEAQPETQHQQQPLQPAPSATSSQGAGASSWAWRIPFFSSATPQSTPPKQP